MAVGARAGGASHCGAQCGQMQDGGTTLSVAVSRAPPITYTAPGRSPGASRLRWLRYAHPLYMLCHEVQGTPACCAAPLLPRLPRVPTIDPRARGRCAWLPYPTRPSRHLRPCDGSDGWPLRCSHAPPPASRRTACLLARCSHARGVRSTRGLATAVASVCGHCRPSARRPSWPRSFRPRSPRGRNKRALHGMGCGAV